jgi:hypothetical protein
MFRVRFGNSAKMIGATATYTHFCRNRSLLRRFWSPLVHPGSINYLPTATCIHTCIPVETGHSAAISRHTACPPQAYKLPTNYDLHTLLRRQIPLRRFVDITCLPTRLKRILCAIQVFKLIHQLNLFCELLTRLLKQVTLCRFWSMLF